MKKSLLLLSLIVGFVSPSFAFDIGDVVYLKSGSRPMTVITLPAKGDDGVQIVSLQWDNGQTLSGGSLPEASLTLIDPAAAIAKKRADDASKQQ